MGRPNIASVGFKSVVERKFKKSGVPFFGFRVDDGSHIVIEDGLRYTANLSKELDMRIKDLKLSFTMVEMSKAVEGMVEYHGGHWILAPVCVDLEVCLAKVKLCAEPRIGILSDVDFPMTILVLP